VDPEHEVCLCFRVSLRKIRAYLARENPPVASLISECLSAGTGCQWCVPFLKHLHAQHAAGLMPDLKVSPEEYMRARSGFHKTGQRDAGVVGRAMEELPAADRGDDAGGGGDHGAEGGAGSKAGTPDVGHEGE
jgi:bacterioferritin-associated ferredoxin